MRNRFRVILILVMGITLLCPWHSLGNNAREPLPLYIIERDTLQTRNFTPVINHETMIVNLGEHALSMDIISDIPSGKFKKGNAYPAFLEESLLPDPLFAPLEVSPTRTTHLDKPEITTKKGDTSFLWKDLRLPTGEAIIAQYDNYFGEPDLYRRHDGFDIEGLEIKTDYSVHGAENSEWQISLAYTVRNKTPTTLKDLSLGVFIPLTLLHETGATNFFELTQICLSPNINYSRVTRADGFGRAASGVDAIQWTEKLAAGATISFSLRLVGYRKIDNETIWPLLTVMGRNPRKAIWPPTVVHTKEPVREGRFSYLSYNLIIQDRERFILSPKGIKVESLPRSYP